MSISDDTTKDKPRVASVSSTSSTQQPLNLADSTTGSTSSTDAVNGSTITSSGTATQGQQQGEQTMLSMSEITDSITERLNEILVHLNKKDKETTVIFDNIEKKLDAMQRKL
ncbi:unnamed protein product [Ambrosiozyma monospora]|uniref:Unnamed protein product n=1 Tax=Ambrosiozyma monospora TaxID=43982 RepID=A0ACB5SRA5_AMBMO|nr:unnamed protein product [Ambrosiozyma monospora]